MDQVIELLKVLTWPLVCVGLAILFRQQVVGVVGRIVRFEVPGFKAELDEIKREQNARINAQYWYLQGEISQIRELLEEAESYFRTSIEIDPTYTIAHTKLAEVLRKEAQSKSSVNLKLRTLSEAIDSCSEAEKAEETYPKKDRQLGSIYLLRAALRAEFLEYVEPPGDDADLRKVRCDLELALDEDDTLVTELDKDPALTRLATLPWFQELKETYGD